MQRLLFESVFLLTVFRLPVLRRIRFFQPFAAGRQRNYTTLVFDCKAAVLPRVTIAADDVVIAFMKRRDGNSRSTAKRSRRKKVRRERIEQFPDTLRRSGNLVTEFDERMWNALVESLTVYSYARVVFTFKDGTKVEWKIR